MANRSVLGSMNFGLFGISQIGKFITVYPSDDGQAVRLAVALDAATTSAPGSTGSTDRPLGQGLVHYRYGSMIRRPSRTVSRPRREGVNDLLDPAGRLIDDVRVDFYWRPDPAIVDPFGAAVSVFRRPDVGGSSTAGIWSAMPSDRAAWSRLRSRRHGPAPRMCL